jgi:hypothetical protein
MSDAGYPGDGTMAVFVILFMVIGFIGYFAPTFVAWRRHHRNLPALFILNLLLGWTVVGWALAMVWAWVRGSGEA